MLIKTSCILDNFSDGEAFIDIWIPQKTFVVLGRYSELTEVQMNEIKKNDIPIFRREGGGGTVVLNKNTIVIDIGIKGITSKNVRYYLNEFGTAISEAVNEIYSVKTYVEKEFYDLVLWNKKFGGSSLYISGKKLLYGCSIIISKQAIQNINKLLLIPKKQPIYRNNRNHEEFLISLDLLKPNKECALENKIKCNLNNFINSLGFSVSNLKYFQYLQLTNSRKMKK